MNIAIIEDNKNDIDKLLALLDQYRLCHEIIINTHTYSSGESFLVDGAHKKYDLLLMDIYLEDIDGIETVTRLQSIRDDALIAFLTSSEEDIWRAVKTHGCFDYIQKNELNYARIDKLLTDVINKSGLKEKKVEFQSGKQKISLKLQNIQYVTSRDKYIMVVFKSGLENRYRFPFSQFCDLIKEDHRFLLCNRGVLLNMDYIQQTDGVVYVMKNNVQFPIRRKDRKKIIQLYNNYQFENLDKQELFL